MIAKAFFPAVTRRFFVLSPWLARNSCYHKCMNSHDSKGPLLPQGWRVISDSKSKEFHDLVRTEGFHKLDVENCGHPRRLPKVVERPGYVFMIAELIQHDPKTGRSVFIPADFFIKPNGVIVVSAHSLSALTEKVAKRFVYDEKPPDGFQLAYAALDEIVDEYLASLDAVGESIQHIEEQAVKPRLSHTHTLQRIFHIKKTLGDFRRNAVTMREMVNTYGRVKPMQERGELATYVHDVQEHLVQVLEFIETYRDALTVMLDMHLMVAANRTNDVVKILAVYGTIALPFMVITGFYGMNIRLPFQELPQAAWILVAGMTLFALGMFWYFKRKQWF